MQQQDLKLERASVRVSNANQADRVYSIEADFNTSNHELVRVDSGMVSKDGKTVCTFYKNYDGMSNQNTYTFYAEANTAEMKCEIITLIEEFEDAAEAVVFKEVNE
jgi:hypothetical protein